MGALYMALTVIDNPEGELRLKVPLLLYAIFFLLVRGHELPITCLGSWRRRCRNAFLKSWWVSLLRLVRSVSLHFKLLTEFCSFGHVFACLMELKLCSMTSLFVRVILCFNPWL
jgi:hypothetical protein